MYTYLKRNIKNNRIDINTLLDEAIYPIGSTYQDYLDNKYILLSDAQLAFLNSHPTANPNEIITKTVGAKETEEVSITITHDIVNDITYTYNNLSSLTITSIEDIDSEVTIVFHTSSDFVLNVPTNCKRIGSLISYPNCDYIVSIQNGIVISCLVSTKNIDFESTDNELICVVLSSEIDTISSANQTIYVYLNGATKNPGVYTTNSDGIITLNIPKETSYRIVFPQLDGCDAINDIEYTASQNTRTIYATIKPYADKYEQVTVTAYYYVTNESKAFANVPIYITLNGVTTNYKTNTNGKVTVDIPIGAEYTVSSGAMSNTYQRGESSFIVVASAPVRQIQFHYYANDVGLFFVDEDGVDYTYEEVQAIGKDNINLTSLIKFATKSLIDYKSVFYIDFGRKNFLLGMWSPRADYNFSCNVNELNSVDQNYWNGLLVTTKIIKEAQNGGISIDNIYQVANTCMYFNNGVTLKGFVPSAGQAQILVQNKYYISGMLTLLDSSYVANLDSILDNAFWLNCDPVSQQAYICKNNSIYNQLGKTGKANFAPFFA